MRKGWGQHLVSVERALARPVVEMSGQNAVAHPFTQAWALFALYSLMLDCTIAKMVCAAETSSSSGVWIAVHCMNRQTWRGEDRAELARVKITNLTGANLHCSMHMSSNIPDQHLVQKPATFMANSLFACRCIYTPSELTLPLRVRRKPSLSSKSYRIYITPWSSCAAVDTAGPSHSLSSAWAQPKKANLLHQAHQPCAALC